METRDVYFLYEQQAFGSLRRKTKFLVDSFQFDGELKEYSFRNFPPREVIGDQFVKLFCRCGGCDFNDDGYSMHVYCCNCCGKYITVYRRTDHGEDTKEN
ncbi:hypothetical protein BRM13313_00072 [Salmonella phage BRM 13313]|nr:hypothetical protein BRM13313_00072 [Salmonella phage BRM 13313]